MRQRLCSMLVLAVLLAAAVHAAPVTLASDDDSPAREAAIARLSASAAAGDAVFHGGQALALRGLLAGPSLSTDVALRNLAPAANRCAVALLAADGSRLAPSVELTLAARETRPYVDVFANVANVAVAGLAEVAVACAGEFSAYAVVTDRNNGWLDRVGPEPAREATLAAPDGTAPPCPAGAQCFDALGVVHVPEPPPGNPVGRVTFPAPAGIAKRLRLTIDVTVGPWYPPSPSGKHLMYWFVVNRNIDMPGMLYFLGPNKNQAFARHGIGLKHPQKIKIIRPFTAIQGTTYHIDNDYDMTGRSYSIKISNADTGSLRLKMRGVPNVTSYGIKPGSNFLIDMGFPPPTDNPTEVPSYGWTYANVHVEAYMR